MSLNKTSPEMRILCAGIHSCVFVGVASQLLQDLDPRAFEFDEVASIC